MCGTNNNTVKTSQVSKELRSLQEVVLAQLQKIRGLSNFIQLQSRNAELSSEFSENILKICEYRHLANCI
jgi:hypothetical protein